VGALGVVSDQFWAVALMAHYDHFKQCGHGKRYDERCVECEIVSAREGLAWAKIDVERYEARLAQLEIEKPLIGHMTPRSET